MSTPSAQPAGAIGVSGAPTDEEVAAVVAVLAAASRAPGGSAERPGPRPASGWSSRRELLRGRHDPGPGSWRTAVGP